MGHQQTHNRISGYHLSRGMAEIVNLRSVRKRAARRQHEERAASNRLAYGTSKAERSLAETQSDKAQRHLDLHRVETGDDR
jgi:hypothetical protein